MHATLDKLSAFPLAPLIAAFAGVYSSQAHLSELLLSVWVFDRMPFGTAWRLSDFWRTYQKTKKERR